MAGFGHHIGGCVDAHPADGEKETERLASRVLSMLNGQDGKLFSPAYDATPYGDDLAGHESSLLDWGVVYGIVLGVARLDDPLESIEHVAVRAGRAAAMVWAQYDEFIPRDQFERIEITLAPEHQEPVADTLALELTDFDSPVLDGLSADDKWDTAILARDRMAAVVAELCQLRFGEVSRGGPSWTPVEVTLRMRRDRVRQIGEHLLTSGTDWGDDHPREKIDLDHAAGRSLLDQLEAGAVAA